MTSVATTQLCPKQRGAFARSGIVMITRSFDFLAVSFCRRIVEYDSDVVPRQP